MLKVGCCIGSFITSSDLVGVDILPEVKKAGYDYAELPLNALAVLDDKDVDLYIEKALASGVPIEACNSFFPGSLRLTGKTRDPEKITAYLKKAFQIVKRLGVKRLVFGSAGAKNVPEGYSYKNAFNEVVAVLKEAAEYAKDADCMIVIEPLNTVEANFINNTADGYLLVEAVNHPNVQLLVDYYHYYLVKDHLTPPTASVIHHCHFADPDGRKYPEIWKPEFEEFIKELENCWGYQERISIEADPKRGLTDLYQFPKFIKK